MTEVVGLVAVASPPTQAAVLCAMRGPVGAHVGIWYAANDDGRRFVHLAWHYRLKDDDAPPEGSMWVRPLLDENALSGVRTSAHLVARRSDDGRVPYAFARGDAMYDAQGQLRLGSSLGLTCADFVLLVFEHARIDLVDQASFDTGRDTTRRDQDGYAQAQLVEYLHAGDAEAQQQAKRIEGQVGICTRIRAEEVAAASGLPNLPVVYSRAESAGRDLLQRLPDALPP